MRMLALCRSWVAKLTFFQSPDRRFLEEQAGTAGLPGIEVIEHGAQRLPVELDGARTGPAADGPTRVVELDGMLRVPCPAVVARDEEVNLLTACAGTDNLRGNDPAVFQRQHLMPPTLRTN